MPNSLRILCAVFAAASLASGVTAEAANHKIVSDSSDLTGEFYQDFDQAFAAYWKNKTGDTVTVGQSHHGAGKQILSALNGQGADVVTMSDALDIDLLHQQGRLLPQNWATRLPNKSVPYVSTIVFVVRGGNPKNIRNWDDLVQTNLTVIIPNPKTCGAGRYCYLAAWGYALNESGGLRRAGADVSLADSPRPSGASQVSSSGHSLVQGGDEQRAREFVTRLFANVPLLDSGERGATITFAARGIGDVLLTFEDQAALVQREFPTNHLQVVLPTESILVENPVAWVDFNVRRHHTEAVARAYLEYLYSDEGQELAAQHFFRPRNQAILTRYSTRYKPLELFTVNDVAGGWEKAQHIHFSAGGVFDQIYNPKHYYESHL